MNLQERLTEKELEIDRLNKELQVLRIKDRIFTEVANMSSFPDVVSGFLERLMDQIIELMETDAGTIFLINKFSDNIKFHVMRGNEQTYLLKSFTLSPGEGIVGHVIDSGEYYLTEDINSSPFWEKEASEMINYETRNILCVPLKTPERVFGAIQVINKLEGRPFDDEDPALLTTIANLAALILTNADLFNELKKKVDTLVLIQRLSGVLNSSLDPKMVMERAMEAIVMLLGSEVGSLLLMDEENQELYFDVVLGEMADVVKEIRLKVGEGAAGWVAKNAQPLIINDAKNDPRIFRQADELSGYDTRNMLCVPVVQEGKVVGVLQALNKENELPFTQEDADLLTTLSHQVSIAVENSQLHQEVKELFLSTVESLGDAIEKRDPYTGGHVRRVVSYSLSIGERLELNESQKEQLWLSATLHDLGKIGVEDAILRKPGKLDEIEFAKMKAHSEIGEKLIMNISRLKEVSLAIREHHERLDGTGYPDGLQGEDIVLNARIISVADAYDAMTTNRPYRDKLSKDKAVDIILKGRGTQFDRNVVDAFMGLLKEGIIKFEGNDE